MESRAYSLVTPGPIYYKIIILLLQACFLYTGRDFYAFDISEKLSFCIFGTEFFEN